MANKRKRKDSISVPFASFPHDRDYRYEAAVWLDNSNIGRELSSVDEYAGDVLDAVAAMIADAGGEASDSALKAEALKAAGRTATALQKAAVPGGVSVIEVQEAVPGASEVEVQEAAANKVGELEVTNDKTARATKQAKTIVEWTTVWIPRKISDEQIGDLMEILMDLERAKAHPWRIQAQALSGICWAFLYTARDFVKSRAIMAAIWRLLS